MPLPCTLLKPFSFSFYSVFKYMCFLLFCHPLNYTLSLSFFISLSPSPFFSLPFPLFLCPSLSPPPSLSLSHTHTHTHTHTHIHSLSLSSTFLSVPSVPYPLRSMSYILTPPPKRPTFPSPPCPSNSLSMSPFPYSTRPSNPLSMSPLPYSTPSF